MSIFRTLVLIIVGTSFLTACGSSSADNSNQIDYATLDSLQTELALEIGESPDFLPGRLTNLAVAPNGNILVADWASKTIEQFSPNGDHRATVAQEGEGPGEMGNYFFLHNGASDSIIVRHMDSQHDLFTPDAEGIYQFHHSEKKSEASERSFGISGARNDTSYYASVASVFRSNIVDEAEQQNYYQSPLVVVNSGGELLQDSVQMVKNANPLVERPSSSMVRLRNIPFRHDDELAILPNGDYLIARTDSSAIYKYNSNHEVVKEIPLHITPRPITSDDLDYELDDLDAAIRNKMEARISDHKPPYIDLFATEEHIWLHTDTGEKGKEMVLLDHDGTALGKFMLAEVDEIEQIVGNEIYTIHRSPELGHLIRKYVVQI